MESSDKIIVIIGPTASGKTAAAIEIAKLYNGEIICADSRTIYKYMNIGTAKPTLKEQKTIPHYLIDIIEPNETFSAAKFKKLASTKIDEIKDRGKLPIIVGGTGLYVDSLLYNYEFSNQPDYKLREKLNTLSVEQLQNIILKEGLAMPTNDQNPRHLARVIETKGVNNQKSKMRKDALVLGINPGLEIIKNNINLRIEKMLDDGLVNEVKFLSEKYGWSASGLSSTSYKAFKGLIKGELNIDIVKEQFKKNDYLLARRQLTWFRRNKSIHWFINRYELIEYVDELMNKNN